MCFVQYVQFSKRLLTKELFRPKSCGDGRRPGSPAKIVFSALRSLLSQSRIPEMNGLSLF